MDARSFVSCQEFDETLEKRQRGPGCGKKHSTQAMLRHLARQVQETQAGWRMFEAEAPTDTKLHKYNMV